MHVIFLYSFEDKKVGKNTNCTVPIFGNYVHERIA